MSPCIYTYESIASALAGLSVRDDHRLFDISVYGEMVSQRLVCGVVRQAANEQFGPRGVLLLASAAAAAGAGHRSQAGQAADQTFSRAQQASVRIGHGAGH